MLKTVVLINIILLDPMMNTKKVKAQHLFEKKVYNIRNAFTVTFNQINASMLKKVYF